MKKWWEREDDIKLSDVKTHEDRLRYSEMMYRRWQEIGPNEAPDAIMDFDRFPLEDVTRPWTHPAYGLVHGLPLSKRRRLK